MIDRETMIKRINEEIDKLKHKGIVVNIKMPIKEEDKFSTYSTHELNSISYQVIYAPKDILLYEDEYYINFFLNYLINLYTKSDKILYLLENIKEDACVSLGLVDYNSYFHFTKDKVIVNIDTFSHDNKIFKQLIDIYDKNPRVFIRNIIKNSLINEFNEKINNTKAENIALEEKVLSIEKELVDCKENIKQYEEEVKVLDKKLIFNNSSYSRYEE